MRLSKRCLTHDVAQFGRGVRKQTVAIREQKIELAVAGNDQRQRMNRIKQIVAFRHMISETLAQFLKQPTEGAFAVGESDRNEAAIELRHEIEQIAVMGKDPVASPQFAHEGMRVLQSDGALRCLADMGDDVFGANRITTNQLGDRRNA